MDDNETIITVVRRCIVTGQCDPWADLFQRLKVTIDSTFRTNAPRHEAGQLDHFRVWLPGWLVLGHRLESALDWLEKKVGDGDCRSVDEQEQALNNYLRTTVKSGVGAFMRDLTGRSPIARPQVFTETQEQTIEDRPSRISANDRENLVELKQALAHLPPGLRIPFWLRHYEAFGPLLPEDLNLIAHERNFEAENLRQRIEAEIQGNQRAEFPLSARFIGELLGIPPTADGRFHTVDQRICRARNKLRSQLLPEDENQ